jgi:hypothetical protein
MKIELVPPQFTAQLWPLVEGFFARAMDKGETNDYSLEHIKMYINQGQWHLFVLGEDPNTLTGALAVSLIKYPNAHTAFITCMGGARICTDEMLDSFKALLRNLGATKIQAGGRDSVVRLVQKLGFKKMYTVVETTI